MTGRRIFWVILAFCVSAAYGSARERHRGDMSVSTGDGPIEHCSQLRITFDGIEAARAEETFTLAAPRGALKLRAPLNSGVFVHGASRTDVSITACKGAANAEDLARITAKADTADLQAQGPEGRDWFVYFIVRAPRSASLDLEARNGPLSVRGMTGEVAARTRNGPLSLEDSSGRIQADATNGPISVKDCTGTVQASAANGPVSVSGSGGEVNIATENGPISIDLGGNRWDGKLEAHARNGPLTLSLPDGYSSGVRVESSGRTPFQCRARACEGARRNWTEDSRSVEFGQADSPAVLLSTVNGPVSIRSDRSAED